MGMVMEMLKILCGTEYRMQALRHPRGESLAFALFDKAERMSCCRLFRKQEMEIWRSGDAAPETSKPAIMNCITTQDFFFN